MTIVTNIHLQIFTLVKECCKEGDDQGEKFCFKMVSSIYCIRKAGLATLQKNMGIGLRRTYHKVLLEIFNKDCNFFLMHHKLNWVMQMM